MYRKTKGFTLIELIVVMAIITILSSVLVANYSFYIKSANTSKAEQIGRMIYTSAMRAYAEDDKFNKDNVELKVKEDVNIDGIDISVNAPTYEGSCISVKFNSNSNGAYYTVSINGKNSNYNVVKIS